MTPMFPSPDWQTAEPWTPSVPDELYDPARDCPDCGKPFPVGLPSCPSCGLEEEEIAGRVE